MGIACRSNSDQTRHENTKYSKQCPLRGAFSGIFAEFPWSSRAKANRKVLLSRRRWAIAFAVLDLNEIFGASRDSYAVRSSSWRLGWRSTGPNVYQTGAGSRSLVWHYAGGYDSVRAAQGCRTRTTIRRPEKDELLHVVIVIIMYPALGLGDRWKYGKAIVKLDLLWHIWQVPTNVCKGVGGHALRWRRRWRWCHIISRLYAHIVVQQGLCVDHHLRAIIKPVLIVAGVRLNIVETAARVVEMRMGSVGN